MQTRSTYEKIQICFGVLFILMGIASNEWVVAATMGAKGVSDASSVRVFLWVVSLAFLGWGAVVLMFRRYEWVGNLNLMFVLSGSFFVAGEAALWVRAWHRYGATMSTVTDSLLVYREDMGRAIPRAGYKSHGSKTSVEINSLGFRGEEITLDKPHNTLRIACIGGSTTFCTLDRNLVKRRIWLCEVLIKPRRLASSRVS